MKRKSYSRRERTTTNSVLRLPDLEHAKAAVLNSLTSLDAQRGYRHATDEFVDWYCTEPRLALNGIVVLRYATAYRSLFTGITAADRGLPASRAGCRRVAARLRKVSNVSAASSTNASSAMTTWCSGQAAAFRSLNKGGASASQGPKYRFTRLWMVASPSTMATPASSTQPYSGGDSFMLPLG